MNVWHYEQFEQMHYIKEFLETVLIKITEAEKTSDFFILI